MTVHLPRKRDWAFRHGGAVCRYLRLRPPFNIEIDEPDQGVFYFVTHGSVWLECELLRDTQRRLPQGSGVGISARHVLRDASSGGSARALAPDDLAPFLGPPEEGTVEIYMASAPARIAVLQAEPGRALMVIGHDQQPAAENLAHLVALARNELSYGASDSHITMRRVGEMIMIQMLRFSRGQMQNPHVAMARPDIHDDRLMRALLAFLDSLAHPWSVQQLAEVAGMSRAAFAARFTALMGEPPLVCLTRIRLEEAAAHLEAGRKSLADIAGAVGYGSENSFIRAFRREFGVSPKAWLAEGGRLADRRAAAPLR